MKWGEDLPAGHDLTSLRLLSSVGEPINPEAWMWYRTHIGGERCPIVDTWWQTETGGILITPLPGITATTGQAIVAFVTVKGAGTPDAPDGEAFVRQLRDHVAHEIGPIANRGRSCS